MAREKWISLLSYKCGKAHANICEAENTIDKTIDTLCEIMNICDTVEVINSDYPELHKNMMVAFNAYIEHCDAIEEMSRKIYTFVNLLSDIAAGADSRRTEETNELSKKNV